MGGLRRGRQEEGSSRSPLVSGQVLLPRRCLLQHGFALGDADPWRGHLRRSDDLRVRVETGLRLKSGAAMLFYRVVLTVSRWAQAGTTSAYSCTEGRSMLFYIVVLTESRWAQAGTTSAYSCTEGKVVACQFDVGSAARL